MPRGGAVAVPDAPVRRAAAGSFFSLSSCAEDGHPAGRRCCRFSRVPCPLASWPLSCYIATVRNGEERSILTSGGVLGVKRTEILSFPNATFTSLRHRRARAGWQFLSQTVIAPSAFIAPERRLSSQNAAQAHGREKGVSNLLCEAPGGPFRQNVPAPFPGRAVSAGSVGTLTLGCGAMAFQPDRRLFPAVLPTVNGANPRLTFPRL